MEILQNTLSRLQQGSDFRPDDPAVIQIKRQLVRSIAELEMMRESPARPEPEMPALPEPIVVLRMR